MLHKIIQLRVFPTCIELFIVVLSFIGTKIMTSVKSCSNEQSDGVSDSSCEEDLKQKNCRIKGNFD